MTNNTTKKDHYKIGQSVLFNNSYEKNKSTYPLFLRHGLYILYLCEAHPLCDYSLYGLLQLRLRPRWYLSSPMYFDPLK